MALRERWLWWQADGAAGRDRRHGRGMAGSRRPAPRLRRRRKDNRGPKSDRPIRLPPFKRPLVFQHGPRIGGFREAEKRLNAGQLSPALEPCDSRLSRTHTLRKLGLGETRANASRDEFASKTELLIH